MAGRRKAQSENIFVFSRLRVALICAFVLAATVVAALVFLFWFSKPHSTFASWNFQSVFKNVSSDDQTAGHFDLFYSFTSVTKSSSGKWFVVYSQTDYGPNYYGGWVASSSDGLNWTRTQIFGSALHADCLVSPAMIEV